MGLGSEASGLAPLSRISNSKPKSTVKRVFFVMDGIMARIRTVKPEFFRHHRLYVAEKESGLPLRVAFAGLWTVADRAGRFAWEPIQIKLDCLPYDEVDFSVVLDALETRGFIMKYAKGKLGMIPGFNRHQVINNKERESSIAEPTKEESDAWASRGDALQESLFLDQGEGKGKEGKGKGKEGASSDAENARWEKFWSICTNKTGKIPARKAWDKLTEAEQLKAISAWAPYAKNCIEKRISLKDPQGWLNDHRFDDQLEHSRNPQDSEVSKNIDACKKLNHLRKNYYCPICGV